jgi:hypothetical protein
MMLRLASAVGTTNKTTAVGNIMAQSAQEQSDAAYLRSAAKTALLAGEIGAGATLLGGIGQRGWRGSANQRQSCRRITTRTN